MTSVQGDARPTRRDRERQRCAVHDEREAVARCARCATPMCSECFRYRADGGPCCARCAYAIDRSHSGRGALAVAFVGLSASVLAWAVPRFELFTGARGYTLIACIAIPVIAIAVWVSGRDARRRRIALTVRDTEEEVEAAALDAAPAHPYRGRGRRALAAMTPRVSGKATALVVGGSLLVAAAAFPAAVRLPRWLEIEGVLGLWWLVFASVATALLYRGFRLRHDLVYFLPWEVPSGGGRPVPSEGRAGGRGCSGTGWGCSDASGLDAIGCGEVGEGALVLAVVAVAALVFLGGAWLLAEFAFPTVMVFGYLATQRALGRIARDHHGCQGELARSICWGALWASLYVAPLALVTWLVHLAVK